MASELARGWICLRVYMLFASAMIGLIYVRKIVMRHAAFFFSRFTMYRLKMRKEKEKKRKCTSNMQSDVRMHRLN